MADCVKKDGGKLLYRVYEARLKDGTLFRFCCSSVREVSLRQQIAEGKWYVTIERLLCETADRNKARAMADEI